MKLETVTIDLGNGDHAVVFKDVLRVTARLHEAKLKEYMKPVGKPAGPVKMSDLERMETMPKTDYTINLDDIDNDAINELFIVNQVQSWTIDGPVNHETIEHKMTREQYKILVQEMDRLYKPVPLAGSAK